MLKIFRKFLYEKILSAILCLSMMISFASCVFAEEDAFCEGYPVAEPLEFTDIGDTDPDFFDFKMLSRVGVIVGNDKGEANIKSFVTRAEATAMVIRFR